MFISQLDTLRDKLATSQNRATSTFVDLVLAACSGNDDAVSSDAQPGIFYHLQPMNTLKGEGAGHSFSGKGAAPLIR